MIPVPIVGILVGVGVSAGVDFLIDENGGVFETLEDIGDGISDVGDSIGD